MPFSADALSGEICPTLWRAASDEPATKACSSRNSDPRRLDYETRANRLGNESRGPIALTGFDERVASRGAAGRTRSGSTKTAVLHGRGHSLFLCGADLPKAQPKRVL